MRLPIKFSLKSTLSAFPQKIKGCLRQDSFALWGLLVILLNFVMLHGIGFASDLTFWRHWISDLQHGVAYFTGNYPPLYVLWLRVVGWIYQVTGLNMDLEYELKQFCLFPVILAHISLAHFVWLRIHRLLILCGCAFIKKAGFPK